MKKEKPKRPECKRHKWRIASYRMGDNPETDLKCSLCNKRRRRPATPHEVRKREVAWKKRQEESEILHRVYRDFSRRFGTPGKWKYRGWDFMSRMEKWAEGYPDDVFMCGIDDTHFASSDLYFILHRNKRRLWGITVIVLPQLDGQEPCEFFMYPTHMDGVLYCLRKFEKFACTDKLMTMFRKIRKKARKS